MNEKTRLKLKMISSLLMCILSLFSMVALTFSWFAYNNQTHGSGMSIQLQNDGLLLGVEYYKLEPAGESYKLVKCNNDASLGLYSRLDTHYQILVKLYLDKEMTELTLTAKTETEQFLGKKEDLLGKSGNTLSSIVAFGMLAQDDIKDNTIDLKKLEEKAVTTMVAGSFIQKSVTIGTTNKFGTETYNGQECKSAWFFITYDQALTNAVLLENISNDNITGLEQIPFVCDFTIEISDKQTT